MSKYVIDSSTLTSIADAVRTKGGTTDPIVVSDIPTAITNLPSGGGGDLPEEAFTISGNCSYRFANNGWNWFIEKFGDKITTEKISSAQYMFPNVSLEKIPFDINLSTSGNINIDNIFYNSNIKTLPYINGKIQNAAHLFDYCKYLNSIPEDWAEHIDWSYFQSYTYSTRGYIFQYCNSLRHIPESLMAVLYGTVGTGVTTVSHYCQFNCCYSLDEINNVVPHQATLTANRLASMFFSCWRLKNATFALQDDGTPYTVNWKSQVADLTSNVGYAFENNKSYILDYNSGITADKEVTNYATYQALKNDPDWFTCDVNYSRYNHDSAVATINSLPDTSAYLATAGGTNTIKFRGQAGASTDGGAINTLTEEEIAVAAAKGWTVTLV